MLSFYAAHPIQIETRDTQDMNTWRWAERLRAFFARFRKTEISLIEADDLRKLLKDIGRLDDLLAGKLQCFECHKSLSLENLSGFILRDGEYHFFCDGQICLSKIGK